MLGYPVTLRMSDAEFETYDFALVLHLGTSKVPAVDCYCSMPIAPTNPFSRPQIAWCLVPKSDLQAGAT